MGVATSGDFQFGGEIVWRPSPEIIAQSNLQHFIDQHHLGSFAELMRRSTTDIEWFWNAVIADLDIQFYQPYSKIVDLSHGPAFPQWCVGGQLNLIHNCLDKYTGTPTDQKFALRSVNEDGTVQTFTYAQLRDEVNKCANHLRSLGLGKGDAVGVYMPMNSGCVISMLAIAKIGGIFLPLFSGYGAEAIVSRLVDAEAKLLICSDAGTRRGQLVKMQPIAEQAAANIPTLRQLLVVPQRGPAPWSHESNIAATERTSAEDPFMIIYTSGTTGKPKGTVHTHCGFPIKAAQDMLHGLDLHADETIFWITDIGWMMGPWLIAGTLLIGATIMVFDGAPDFPGPDRLWELVENHKVTTLGVSPTLIRALLRHGEEPVRRHNVSTLRKFASTGEPWNPDPWLWLFNVVGGGKLPIINYSGGTEISGGIVMGNVLTPMKPCCFSGPLPGMAADVVDDSGHSVRGQVGELIIRQPWIGMTRGFWKDEQRYLDTYWSRLPGVWVHGDWAAVDADGLWYILGRSDDTIKIAGKRLGPAEVESVLVAHPAVAEAAAIGVPDELKGDALVCFCVLKSGHSPTDILREELRQRIASSLGKPLKPKELKFVRDIPKTRNAKVMRRVVRAVYLGQELKDTSSLDNHSALDDIRHAV
jgi:acetyl-CoA synthetase